MSYSNTSLDSEQLASFMSSQDSFTLPENSLSCSSSPLSSSSFSPVYGAAAGVGLGADFGEVMMEQQQQAVVSALAQQFQKSTVAAQTQAMLQLLIPLVNQGSDNLGKEDEKFQKPGNALYKTEMCRSYEETGVCKYGRKCQYAHGVDEVRSTLKHPKFKTIACETILKGGVCPYGKRCRFIHPSDSQKQFSGPLVEVASCHAVNEHRRLPVFQSLTLQDQFSA